MTEFGLENKTAIITGSGQGIGRAIAIELSNHGANVVVTARTGDKIKETVRTIQETTPGDAIAVKGDITDSSHIKKLFETTKTEFGGLDILVNNAGIYEKFDIEKNSIEDIQKLLDVNLRASAHCALYAAREFKEKNTEDNTVTGDTGRILNISSAAARIPRAQSFAYAVSKAGMNAMTRSLAVALAPYDVLVNGIAPGFIRTPLTEELLETDSFQEYWFEHSRIPQARHGEPDEVARVARFLISPENTYITGQTIFVDGGAVISA